MFFMQKLEVMELYIFQSNLYKNNFKQNCLKENVKYFVLMKINTPLWQ